LTDSPLATSIFDYKTELLDFGSLGKVRVRRPMLNPLRFRRRILHGLAHTFHDLMTRTEVYGQENIPARGPVLILPNHVSNLDGILVLAYYPRQIEMVGPGDFKMVTLKDWLLRAYGVTPVNRGRADSAHLRALVDHLRSGRDLLMFPDGGMWEKRRFVAKEGAAYLSQLTGAPILPVGLSGTYLKTIDAFTGRRPPLAIRFGKLMPAVPPSRDRRARNGDLNAASAEIMARIWELLEPEEQARYRRWEREIYRLQIDFLHAATGEPLAYDGPPLPDMGALAEFIAKPNLFRPMWENARLNIDPFRQTRFFGPLDVRFAARDMGALLLNEYDRYLPYRIGDEAALQVDAALEALRTTVSEWAMARGALVRLTPVCIDPEEEG